MKNIINSIKRYVIPIKGKNENQKESPPSKVESDVVKDYDSLFKGSNPEINLKEEYIYNTNCMGYPDYFAGVI